MKINFIRAFEDAIVPTRGSSVAAGYDLYCWSENGHIQILPHTTKLIHTGIKIAIPEGYFGGIYARSGLATKQGLRPANAVGVVDSDYRGEVMVALHNDTEEAQVINRGDRIAQLIIQPYLEFELEEVNTLDETERGAGGFGSSGK